MVARAHDDGPPLERLARPSGAGPAGRAFLAWRRLLTRLLLDARAPRRRRPGSLRATASLVARYLRDPATALAGAQPEETRSLARVGIACLLGGVAIAAAVGRPAAGDSIGPVIGTAATALLWAAGRFALLRMALPDARRRSVADAWGAGSIPLLLAVVFPLDLLALVASWYLTERSLVALGCDRRGAATAAALAFGGQLAVSVLAWGARGGFIILAGRF